MPTPQSIIPSDLSTLVDGEFSEKFHTKPDIQIDLTKLEELILTDPLETDVSDIETGDLIDIDFTTNHSHPLDHLKRNLNDLAHLLDNKISESRDNNPPNNTHTTNEYSNSHNLREISLSTKNLTSSIHDQHLNQLSPFFQVSQTKYGGRGCFASTSIPKGTEIHSSYPISVTISKPFKKEVCTNCFHYDNGKTLKTKLSKSLGTKQVFTLFFCTEQCKQKFIDEDINGVYTIALLNIEKYYLQGLKKPDEDLKVPSQNVLQIIDEEWSKVAVWESKMLSTKPIKRMNEIPRISETEYIDIKYIVGVVFKLFKYENQKPVESKGLLEQILFPELTSNESSKVELNLFTLLQSTELEKVVRYPYLLYSYINMYKFIKLTSCEELQPFITSSIFRSILGKNLSNAFGIWSDTCEAEDKEYFGFGVFPSCSFFNHSCDPNIKKARVNNRILFRTTRDIEKDEELCIDYGNYLNENVLKRREELAEWFFDCGCGKCERDLAEIES